MHDERVATLAAIEAFVAASEAGHGPVIRQTALPRIAEDLDLNDLIANGGLKGSRYVVWLDRYLSYATRLHHPAYMAHQVAAPHPMGALGSFIDGSINNAMAVYEMGPGASAIEFTVLNWMISKVGWRPGQWGELGDFAGGVLTNGGSLANLTALLAARSRSQPNAWRDGVHPRSVILAPAAAHYSIARAVGIMGLPKSALVACDVDGLGRLKACAVKSKLAEMANLERPVIAVVANACATALGLYDPLRELAQVCRPAGAWLHVDGAHGASALVSPRHRQLLDGVELADSIVWDAHKLLRTPTLCAAVLVRDQRDLDRAFTQDASYLFHDKDQPGVDFISRTVECTKSALALKLFLVLAAEGEAALADHVDAQFALAQAAAELIRRTPGLELCATPESNIVCFRTSDGDVAQLEIRRRLTHDGAFYISTAEYGGERWLRMALMSPSTTLATIQALLEEVLRQRACLVAEGQAETRVAS